MGTRRTESAAADDTYRYVSTYLFNLLLSTNVCKAQVNVMMVLVEYIISKMI